jgi:hypothetical protein
MNILDLSMEEIRAFYWINRRQWSPQGALTLAEFVDASQVFRDWIVKRYRSGMYGIDADGNAIR